MLIEHEDMEKDRRKDLTMVISVFIVITGMIGMHLFGITQLLQLIYKT